MRNTGLRWTEEQLKAHAEGDKVPSWARTEQAFKAEICRVATQLGWTWFHVVDSFRSEAGFPDLVLVRPPRLIFAELKTEKRKETKEQGIWLDLLRRSDIDSYLWRPSMYDEIVRILK